MDDQPQGVDADPHDAMMALLDAEENAEPDEVEESAAEPEEADDEAEESSEAAAADAEFEVIVHNGEEKKLTKDELKTYAQQGFDYTQKTQQLAEQRRYLDEQHQAIQFQAQVQAQFTEQFAEVKAIDSQLAQYKAVNWSELAQTDPMQYLSLHHQYTEAKEAREAKISELNQLQTQAQHAQQQMQAQRLAQEAQAMTQAIPEWKDPARKTAEIGELRQYLASNGLSAAEIATVADHRQVAIARKAMLYDKMMASGQKKVAAAPPTAKPGAKAANTNTAKNVDTLKRLKATGKGEYAAKLIERML